MKFLCALVAATIGCAVCGAVAQTYPSKPIRMILPFPTGGPTDLLGRQVGIKLTEQMGQPVVPENRPGVGGNLGAEIAAKSPADGYTIVLSANVLAISPSLYRKLNYDPINDLAPLSLVAQLRGTEFTLPMQADCKTFAHKVKSWIAHSIGNLYT